MADFICRLVLLRPWPSPVETRSGYSLPLPLSAHQAQKHNHGNHDYGIIINEGSQPSHPPDRSHQSGKRLVRRRHLGVPEIHTVLRTMDGSPTDHTEPEMTSCSRPRTRKVTGTSPGVLPSGLEAWGPNYALLLHLTLLLGLVPHLRVWARESSGTEHRIILTPTLGLACSQISLDPLALQNPQPQDEPT